MATDKQVKYVQSLQEQYDTEDYTEKEIRNMSHNEVSIIIDERLLSRLPPSPHQY